MQGEINIIEERKHKVKEQGSAVGNKIHRGMAHAMAQRIRAAIFSGALRFIMSPNATQGQPIDCRSTTTLYGNSIWKGRHKQLFWTILVAHGTNRWRGDEKVRQDNKKRYKKQLYGHDITLYLSIA